MTGFASIVPFALCLFTFVQEQGLRHVIPEEFVKSRPARSNKTGTSSTSARRTSYKPASAKPSANKPKSTRPEPSEAMQLGLTIWRLRPSNTADSGARIIVHHDGETEEWTP